MSAPPEKLRLDKWLWAARFFKTRGLAADAIDGGKVKLNGHTAKPAKEVKPGDVLDLTLGDAHWTVTVRGLNEYRRPAPEAQLLYEESAESREQRSRAAEARALAPAPGADLKGRPTKRDRRKIQRFFG
ncbi:RNA-binding S4 domain-containing protein [Azospira restricta]|uniref:RNA-binding S4 domain-containing protein n=1 Tax=Azospira restricta TaxID=404405 RepID=A0A974SQY5_9RHOO|nr:RNA-binding S4 domain-containing protein [Azospira restricta]QRJ64842.1 RNA-binding S4 domain-containing protein [Azospira restricta]